MNHQARLAKYSPILLVPMQIPSSNQTKLIFPIERKTFRFNPTTHNYNKMLTQNRLSEVEMDQILSDIEVPLQEYYKEFSSLYDGTAMCLGILSAILFILIFPICFYMCWISSLQNRALKKMAETRQKVEAIVRQKNQELERRDLYINLPQYFPNWIELWTTLGPRAQMPMQMQNHPQMNPMMANNGIQMKTMPQQDQSGYYNTQYDQHNNSESGAFNQF